MSAPLAVNTLDGRCWTRREGTRGGEALYAPEKCGTCPQSVMVTLTELAEQGIAGSADALPMPVGVGPQPDEDRAKAPWGRGEDGRPLLPMGAHWTDIPELVERTVAGIQSRLDQAQSGHWYTASDTETWRAPGTVRTNVDGYARTVGRVLGMEPADLELVLHAHDDLGWCLGMIAKLRSRVAELEAERQSTNTALVDVTLAQRKAEGRPTGEDPCRPCGCPKRFDRHAWGCPTAEARELAEWCTGCNTDHDPNGCGYRPKSGGAL